MVRSYAVAKRALTESEAKQLRRFAVLVRTLRETRGWSQATLAKKASSDGSKISLRRINDIENAKHNVSFAVAARIVQVLGKSNIAQFAKAAEGEIPIKHHPYFELLAGILEAGGYGLIEAPLYMAADKLRIPMPPGWPPMYLDMRTETLVALSGRKRGKPPKL